MTARRNTSAAINGRDAHRKHEQASAKHDSPDGGLAAIRARNQAEAYRRRVAAQQKEGAEA